MKQSFYEIPKSHYLFNRSHSPEEEIRQWVLFELLSSYKVHINDIRIEYPVKIGTRTHAIDILVFKDHTPYVVIECKRKEASKHELEKAVEQAKSYAEHPDIKAQLIVCTNGTSWQVQQKKYDNWYPVTDLPVFRMEESEIDLLGYLDDFHRYIPLLYWIGSAVPAEEVKAYFLRLHRVFHGNKEGYDTRLFGGTELLLRIFTTNIVSLSDYALGKLQGACQRFGEFFEKIGVVNQFGFKGWWEKTNSENSLSIKQLLENQSSSGFDIISKRFELFSAYFSDLAETFEELAMNNHYAKSFDNPLIRTLVILIRYAIRQREHFYEELSKYRTERLPKLYQISQSYQWYESLSQQEMSEINIFLESLCQTLFRIEFPDSLSDSIEHVRGILKPLWKETKKELGNIDNEHSDDFWDYILSYKKSK